MTRSSVRRLAKPVQRRPPSFADTASGHLKTLLLGFVVGTAAGCLLAAVGLLAALTAKMLGASVSFDGLGDVLYYVAGFGAGGALFFSLLVPLAPILGGRYLLCLIAAAAVFAAVGIAEAGAPWHWHTTDWITCGVPTLLFGVFFGYKMPAP